MRFGTTPFVYTCEVETSQILTEHRGRKESEVLIDIDFVSGIFLDEGEGFEREAHDVLGHEDVSARALKDWTTANDRYSAEIARHNQSISQVLKRSK
jgi:hypothetical protein